MNVRVVTAAILVVAASALAFGAAAEDRRFEAGGHSVVDVVVDGESDGSGPGGFDPLTPTPTEGDDGGETTPTESDGTSDGSSGGSGGGGSGGGDQATPTTDDGEDGTPTPGDDATTPTDGGDDVTPTTATTATIDDSRAVEGDGDEAAGLEIPTPGLLAAIAALVVLLGVGVVAARRYGFG